MRSLALHFGVGILIACGLVGVSRAATVTTTFQVTATVEDLCSATATARVAYTPQAGRFEGVSVQCVGDSSYTVVARSSQTEVVAPLTGRTAREDGNSSGARLVVASYSPKAPIGQRSQGRSAGAEANGSLSGIGLKPYDLVEAMSSETVGDYPDAVLVTISY